LAPPATPAAAVRDASSGLIQVYLRIPVVEPSRWEQYEQSSGHRPDL